MLKVHTSDGRTTPVDLQDADQASGLLSQLGDPHFQATITGLTLTHLGVEYCLPRPAGFDGIVYLAEMVAAEPGRKAKGGERLVCQAEAVRATIMVHQEQRAARVTLSKTGRQRYNPLTDRR